MIDCGTTSHIIPKTDKVSENVKCGVSISLSDESTIKERYKRTRKATFFIYEGNSKGSLSDMPFVLEAVMSLFSVPDLTLKLIGVF